MDTYSDAAEEQYTNFRVFRQACVEGLGAARDVLGALGDAVLVSPGVSSFVAPRIGMGVHPGTRGVAAL